MEKLRICLIGAGFIGVAHGNAIETIIGEKLGAAEFVSVCDTDTERARGIAESFGAKEHCGDAHVERRCFYWFDKLSDRR